MCLACCTKLKNWMDYGMHFSCMHTFDDFPHFVPEILEQIKSETWISLSVIQYSTKNRTGVSVKMPCHPSASEFISNFYYFHFSNSFVILIWVTDLPTMHMFVYFIYYTFIRQCHRFLYCCFASHWQSCLFTYSRIFITLFAFLCAYQNVCIRV